MRMAGFGAMVVVSDLLWVVCDGLWCVLDG